MKNYLFFFLLHLVETAAATPTEATPAPAPTLAAPAVPAEVNEVPVASTSADVPSTSATAAPATPMKTSLPDQPAAVSDAPPKYEEDVLPVWFLLQFYFGELNCASLLLFLLSLPVLQRDC